MPMIACPLLSWSTIAAEGLVTVRITSAVWNSSAVLTMVAPASA